MIDITNMSLEEIKEVIDSQNLTEENVKSLILENKDVDREQTINGYYVRTIVSKSAPNGEIVLKVLAVYERKGDNDVVQYNVDVENLCGTLLTSTAFAANDIDNLSKKFIKYFNMGRR